LVALITLQALIALKTLRASDTKKRIGIRCNTALRSRQI